MQGENWLGYTRKFSFVLALVHHFLSNRSIEGILYFLESGSGVCGPIVWACFCIVMEDEVADGLLLLGEGFKAGVAEQAFL